MQVRFDTRCGVNLVYVARWAFAEVEVAPPAPPPPPPAPVAPAPPPVDAASSASVPVPDPPPPPAPAPASEELPDCTLTLYLAGSAESVQFHNMEARALLGVLISQSGSLT